MMAKVQRERQPPPRPHDKFESHLFLQTEIPHDLFSIVPQSSPSGEPTSHPRTVLLVGTAKRSLEMRLLVEDYKALEREAYAEGVKDNARRFVENRPAKNDREHT